MPIDIIAAALRSRSAARRGPSTVRARRPRGARAARSRSTPRWAAHATPTASKRAHTAPASSGSAVSTKPKLGKAVSQRSGSTPGGAGTAATSIRAPHPEASSIMTSVPQRPAMLMSLPARARPASARSGRTASCARSVSAGAAVAALKLPPGPRKLPRREIAARTTCPGRADALRMSRSARPTTAAASMLGPSTRVVCPPTTGTPNVLLAAAIPSKMRALSPVPRKSTSTIAHGRPPIAAMSLTLVSTLAKPANHGSDATSSARMPSAAKRTWPAPWRSAVASSPLTMGPVAGKSALRVSRPNARAASWTSCL